MPAAVPLAADIATSGITQSANAACREPLMDQTFAYALNAVWQQLDDLLLLEQPMANLPRIEPDPRGNGRGGWRLPQVELPLAGRVPNSRIVNTPNDPVPAPRVCNAVTGSLPRFDAATLKQLYRSRAEYLRRFNAAVDEAAMGRLLVKEDADALKAAAVRTVPVF